MGLSNPIAFRPFAVTFWTTLIYIVIIVPLLVVHESVPPAPDNEEPRSGINLTKAWMDLDVLSRAYHPFNSHENDQIHDWLLLELEDIKKANDADGSNMVIFDDRVANVTTAISKGSGPGTGTYFEGTNIAVYIRGKNDPQDNWWEDGAMGADKAIGQGGVLVNAHYDSVSTGYGATDDGVGVVSVLALVNHFSQPENQPQKGIVALLNNNEEDWLWGAIAFGNSPLMPFAHTFLNLEGAGAGGRVNLFRTTDAEVTEAYKGTKHPFGTVISSDAWALGAIRSGTDYSIFNDVYGIRGLDVAFYRPRARYHTNQDDAKHTSKASVWNMVSKALHTMKGLTGNTGQKFIGPRGDGDKTKVRNGKGTNGVWFDIFGQTFALFDLRSMFAWSLTLLVVSPLILMGMTFILARQGKYYFFSKRASAYEASDVDAVQLGGAKGILRFPLALGFSIALVIGSAYLCRKVNPMIVYSNEYTVYAMMMSLFYFVFWTIMAGANSVRPSALHRGYAIFWLFFFGWVVLVVNTVFEDRFNIAAGYIFVVFQTALFLAAFISLCEMFALPSKASYALREHDDHQAHHRDEDAGGSGTGQVDGGDEEEEQPPQYGGEDQVEAEDAEPEAPSETTPLMGKTTFASGYRRSIPGSRGQDQDESAPASPAPRPEAAKNLGKPYEHEQPWSAKLPSSLWILQFLLLGPFFIILVGQSGLALVASVSQTGADGSSLLVPYTLIATTTILIMLPVTPFIHRVTHHIPILLLVIFAATLTYNLVKFPFSAQSRYKVYFKQTIDLDTGSTTVDYSGLEEYVHMIVSQIPSAMGKGLNCTAAAKAGLTTCSYDGVDVPPNVVAGVSDGNTPESGFADWVTFNVTGSQDEGKASFEIDAKETRSCAITFERPISSFHVAGGNEHDDRFGSISDDGLAKVVLYRRDWTVPWKVDVAWNVGEDGDDGDDDTNAAGMGGKVLCLWDDVNTPGTIPAFDEGLKYAPAWAALSKMQPGLLEGSKAYKV